MASQSALSCIVGPTASGKSDLAVAVARRLGATEIVTADSVQLYRGMNIGSAKPTECERGGVPHHLLDLLDVTETVTVAQFQTWARTAITDCQERDVLPIVVGGSSLYVRAIIDDLEFPGTDPLVRARWNRELDINGSEALHEELARVDPASARRILPTNGRRIVRALEVLEITGRPFQATMPAFQSIYPRVSMVGLDVPREVLDRRIVERVDRMWAAGLVDEVRQLREIGLAEGLTAARALGYQQVLDFLEGRCSEAEARDATITGTRKFARRQERMMKKDPRIQWLRFDSPTLVAEAVDVIGAP